MWKREKLRVGTKIKMLTDNGRYWSKGDVGFICNKTTFHRGDELFDTMGGLWAEIPANKHYDKICITHLLYDPDNDIFKVLKY